MKKLEQLPDIAARQLGGLEATPALLAKIKLKAAEERTPRKPAWKSVAALATAFVLLAVGAVSWQFLPKETSSGDGELMHTRSAGGEMRETEVPVTADLPSGSITLGGEDITFAPEYQRSRVIGHLFQDPLKGTAPNMTIEENLALAYLRAGTAPNAIFSRISRKDKEIFREKLALLDMGLEDRMKQPVGLLSGGQRQALTLLMATLVTPKLLLLDEHTAALDPATAEKVLDLTKSIVAEKKITCLMVTHNMHQALELGNRTLMMDAGRIVFNVKGEARSKMTVDDLLEKFRENAGKILDNDRILLSKVEANN